MGGKKFHINFVLVFSVLSQIISTEIPNCTYFDTVDLTGSKRFPNGSYEYAGVHIPLEQVGTYNYKIFFEGTKIKVPEHHRGCVCKHKPCIRYCCHRHRYDTTDDRKCIDEFKDFAVNITLKDGSRKETMILDHFVIQLGIPIKCNQSFHLWPQHKDYNWQLYENGVLLRSDDGANLTKRDYCLQPEDIVSLGHNYKLMPMNCVDTTFLLYVHLATICILLATSCIYIFLLKLRHIHDQCYFCYLVCLSIRLFTNILAHWVKHLFGAACYFIAYLCYFTNICTFLWVAVIAFDLWNKLVVHMYEVEQVKKSRFPIYSLFVWGTATGMLSMTILADHFIDKLDINPNWKMGYANYDCYAKMTDWSTAIYFFLPAGLLAFLYIILIIITIIKLYGEMKKNRGQLKELGQKELKSGLSLSIYLRLFILAFMDCSYEICGVLCPIIRVPMTFFNNYFCFGFIHSILIILVTISRKDVKETLTHWLSKS